MALSDLAIRRAKPADKPVRLFDGGGLYLEVTPSGGKLWRLKFRHAGKEKKLSIGSYPAVSLSDARDKAGEAKRALAAGVDPAAQKQSDKIARKFASANSFEAVALEFMRVRMSGMAQSTVGKKDQLLKKNLLPWLGSRNIAEITALELLAVLRRVESRGANELAHRCLQIAGQVFRYAISTGRAERNPAADLRGALEPVQVTSHAAITEPEHVGALLRAINSYAGTFVVKCALQLAPMVFVRPGELRQAEWSELDLDRAEWNIPAERMKMREPHLVPLSAQAVEILRSLQQLTGRGRYLFPSLRSGKRAMSENTLNAALRRLGYQTTEMTSHGFRAMARTILDEVLGFRPDFIEHQLAHAVRDPNGRAYNRTKHLGERRKMMQAWADYLDKLRDGAQVIPISNRTAA